MSQYLDVSAKYLIMPPMESDGRSALEVALVRAENARVESERLRELVARLLAQNEVEEAVDANVDRVSPRSSLRYRSSNA